MMKLGTLTQTSIAIVYLEGIAKKTYIEELRRRLNKIKIDSILDSNYVVEMIKDAPFSIFPTIQTTEKPDRLMAELCSAEVPSISLEKIQ